MRCTGRHRSMPRSISTTLILPKIAQQWPHNHLVHKNVVTAKHKKIKKEEEADEDGIYGLKETADRSELAVSSFQKAVE